MSFLSLLFLALLQGLTEFLPVSSSAHLKLFHIVSGTGADALVLDVAVHIGTMAAVCLYFRRDVLLALCGILDVLRGRPGTDGAQLFLLLSLATIPAIVFGLALKLSGWVERLDMLWLMGSTMIIFGIILWWADKRAPQTRTSWNWRDAVIMGLWQAVALVPGVSRSGATITAARLLGFQRFSAARLAMLMSIPTILASGSLLAVDVVKAADWSL
ncbi:MAG: undecaprenyl-diphosphate phosphatase, partial [Paracoccaceae bacterium]